MIRGGVHLGMGTQWRKARRTQLRMHIKAWSSALAVVVFAATSLSFAALFTPVQEAGAASGIELAITGPTSVLYGTSARIMLTATNAGAAPQYNLSFRIVLPPGVSYVPGSVTPTTNGAPTIVFNQPTTGTTTLIWQNVGDLQPSSTQSMSFSVTSAHTTPTATNNHLLPGYSYTVSGSAYVNSTPRQVPQFSEETGKVTSTFTATVTATSKPILISPLKITKTSNDSPTAKLERGVHDHPDVYTFVVSNNEVNPTKTVTVTDWLPAGFEFLGCGGVDHTTTATGTYPGHDIEYPTAPRLGTGAAATAPTTCLAPTSVNTVTTTPPGQPKGIYTEVTWSIGTLPPEGSATVRYYAAIPLRANTLTWLGTATKATTGIQTANLNNNTGPQTRDGQSLTNAVKATGTYTGSLGDGDVNPVTATSSATVIAHNLAVEKTVSTETFTGGKTVHFTLDIQTSEYRYTTDGTITDTLPSGTCPIDGIKNYVTGTATGECDAQAGMGPVLFNNLDTSSTPLPYASVAENANGTFTLTWDLPTPLPTNANRNAALLCR